MIRIFCSVIDKEIVKFAKQIAKKKQTDVMVESYDEYMEIHYEDIEKK
jgi:hypothetical protein